jgi:CRP-like cAMP-binding protein
MASLDNRGIGPSTLEPLVNKLAYRRKLSAEDRTALLTLPHAIKTLEANHYVVREFDRATHSCVMLSGYSVRHKIVAGGDRQIVAIHMKGEMVDLQNSYLGHADHSVQMLTSGKVALIPVAEIDRIAHKATQPGHAVHQEQRFGTLCRPGDFIPPNVPVTRTLMVPANEYRGPQREMHVRAAV